MDYRLVIALAEIKLCALPIHSQNELPFSWTVCFTDATVCWTELRRVEMVYFTELQYSEVKLSEEALLRRRDKQFSMYE